uniref:Uncharacterized protein n=1 Tax=Tanacetum cinerariifolium TaxID=118510 RepID=A0A699H8G5_TANCI|nr:hypothetical protein [Tanacetum cinerariifolium]
MFSKLRREIHAINHEYRVTSTFSHPITYLYDFDIEDAFSSTYSRDYIPASPNYFLASPRNTSLDPSEDLSKYLLASPVVLPFHDDPYMNVMKAYNATSNESPILLPRAPIAPLTIFLYLQSRTQIAGLQREQMGHNDEIVLARIRISTLEMIIEDIQARHRSDMKSLLDKIHALKNHKGGPPDY